MSATQRTKTLRFAAMLAVLGIAGASFGYYLRHDG